MVIALDVFNICYASYYSLKGRLTDTTDQTSIVFGFLKTLIALLEKNFNYRKVFFVFDNKDPKTPSWREQLYPQYKKNRMEFKDEADRMEREKIYRTVNSAIMFIKNLGMNLPVCILERRNTEADDLLALVSHQLATPQNPVILVSSDKDIRQLVNRWVSVWILHRGIMLTPHNFDDVCGVETSGKNKHKISIHPDDWILFRAICGDPSDGIAGISGLGEITAAKLLQTLRQNPGMGFDEFRQALKTAGVRRVEHTVQTYCATETQHAIAVNKAIMDLGAQSEAMRQLQGETVESVLRVGQYNRDAFYAWLHEVKFNSIIEKLDIFDGMHLRRGV